MSFSKKHLGEQAVRSESELRRVRQADALRANLRRRKAQKRGRTEDTASSESEVKKRG